MTLRARLEELARKWRSKYVQYGADGLPVNPSQDREKCASDLESLLSSAEQEQEGWQPIETAPINEYVLLWGGAWWHPFVGRYFGQPGNLAWIDMPTSVATEEKAYPTLWHPLPAAPTQETRKWPCV